MAKQTHIGVVSNNQTGPDGQAFTQGEIMIKCLTLTGNENDEYPIPVRPSFPLAGPDGYGLFFVPDVDTTVEVESVEGIDYINEEYLVYKCSLYSDVNNIPEEFKTNYPKRKGFKFKSVLFMFDDSPGKFLVQLFHSKGHGFELNKDGDVNWKAMRDMMVDAARDILASATNKLEASGKLQASLKSDTLATIEAPMIHFGSISSVQPFVLGTMLLTFLGAVKAMFDTHTHTGTTPGLGSSGPPASTFPVPPPALVSTKIFGE